MIWLILWASIEYAPDGFPDSDNIPVSQARVPRLQRPGRSNERGPINNLDPTRNGQTKQRLDFYFLNGE